MVCPQILWGQTYFNMRYPPDSGTWGSGTNSVVAIGSTYYTSRLMNHSIIGTLCHRFSQSDSFGNMILNTDSTTYLDKHIITKSLKKSSGGFMYQISSIADIGTGKYYWGLMKYGLNGHLIFHHLDTHQYQFVTMNEIQELPDKNFIAVGTIQKSGTHPKDEEVFLVKMDSLGNELWQKSLWLGGNGHNGECIALCDDGGFVVGGAENDYTVGPTRFIKPIVIKLDSLGNLEWRKEYGSYDYSNSAAYSIVQTQDGGYAFVGAVGQEKNGTVNPIYSTIPWVVKLDSLGKVLWKHENENKQLTPYPNDNHFRDILELDDQQIVTCGQQRVIYYKDGVIDSYGMRGVISKYSQDGQQKWFRVYRHPEAIDYWNTLNFLYDIEATSDGGFVAAGTLSPSTDTTQDTWVIKVDSFGCMEPGCEVISVPEIEPAIAALKIYPNPSNGILNIEITPSISEHTDTYEFKLYDMLGKRVYQSVLHRDINTISVSQLPPGVYTYHLGTSVRGMVVLE